MVARRLQNAALQAIESRLAGDRRAILPPCLQFTGKDRHHRIMAQIIVVDQVLVAERHAEHPLPDKRPHLVLDQVLTPRVMKAIGKPRHQFDRPIGLPQE